MTAGIRRFRAKRQCPYATLKERVMGGTARGGSMRKRLIDAGGFLRSFARTHINSDEGIHPAFSQMLENYFTIFCFSHSCAQELLWCVFDSLDRLTDQVKPPL